MPKRAALDRIPAVHVANPTKVGKLALAGPSSIVAIGLDDDGL
jgi:hypothetical protein